MRENFSRRVLKILETHTPERLRSIQIQILLTVTARAFGCRGRAVWHRSPDQALETYALFTAECMRKSTARPKEVFRKAFKLGKTIRCVTGLRAREDLEELVFYLYRGIGIDMRGHLPGEIEVRSCFFSRHYSPAQCARMSLMDAGVIAGICGGGRLAFTERITQGCGRCCAELYPRAAERRRSL